MRNPLLVLCACGAILRILVAMFLPVAPTSDYGWYLSRAQEIAAGLGYQEAGRPTAFWPVGYPGIVALLMRLTGLGQPAAIIGNILFWIASYGAMVGLGSALRLPERARVIAAAIWAFYPASIFYVSQAASEGPYIAFLLFGCWAALSERYGKLAIAGVLFGIAALIKAQTYLFPIIFLATVALMRRERPGWRAVGLAMMLHIAMFAAILPWSLRNYEKMGSFVLISTNGGLTLLNGNNELATGGYVNETKTPAIHEVYARTGIPAADQLARQVEFDKRAKALAWHWIADNPGRFFSLMPRKFIGLWLSDGDAGWSYEAGFPEWARQIFWLKIMNELYYGLIIAAAVLPFPFLLAGRHRLKIPPLPLYAFPLFISLIALVFSGQSRFHVPAMPFLILAAASVFGQLIARRSQDRAA